MFYISMNEIFFFFAIDHWEIIQSNINHDIFPLSIAKTCQSEYDSSICTSFLTWFSHLSCDLPKVSYLAESHIELSEIKYPLFFMHVLSIGVSFFFFLFPLLLQLVQLIKLLVFLNSSFSRDLINTRSEDSP